MDRLFLLPARSRGFPVWARYAVTTVLVLASMGLRFALVGPQRELPFLLCLPAIIITGVVFDRGTGIYATFLSALLVVWFLGDPDGGFHLTAATDLLVFIGVGLFAACVLESLHIALATLSQERANLAQTNERLAGVVAERNTLLSESVHRARNDLQRLAATLRLQGGAAGDPDIRQALDEASGRVAALARINSRLDRHRDDGHGEVDSRGYLEGLAEDLGDGAVGLRPVALATEVESHTLPMAKAVPLALIVNELVGNALKYAYPGEMEGRVEIGFTRDGDDFVLAVVDDGVGSDQAAPAQGTGLGVRLSRALAGQLGGRLEVAPNEPGSCRPGMRWTIRFPASPQK